MADERVVLQLIAAAQGFAANIKTEATSAINGALGATLAMTLAPPANPLPRIDISPPNTTSPGDVPQSTVTPFRDPGFTDKQPTLKDGGDLDTSGAPTAPNLLPTKPFDSSGLPDHPPAVTPIPALALGEIPVEPELQAQDEIKLDPLDDDTPQNLQLLTDIAALQKALDDEAAPEVITDLVEKVKQDAAAVKRLKRPDLQPLVPIDTVSGAPGEPDDLLPMPGLDTSGSPGDIPSVAGFTDPGNQPVGAPGDITLVSNQPDVNYNVDVPDAPDMLGEIRKIVRPEIVPITVDPPPDYQPQQFLGKSPIDPGEPPSNLAGTMRDEFSSVSGVMRAALSSEIDGFVTKYCPTYHTAMAAIESRISKYLEGGTALTEEVQEAILARASSKTDAEYRRARSKIWSEMEQMGHTLPSPIAAGLSAENDKTRRDANSATTRELMVKMAELEQQNMQFALTTSVGLRTAWLSAAINYVTLSVQINGQALEYARSVVDQIVKAYELSTRRSEIQARIYEAEARIYEAKERGALNVIEAYKAKIQGLEAQANVKRAEVDAYRAELEAVQAEATVYRTQVDAAIAKASLERLKVELYQAKVSAYVAQVNAWTAQWMGYKAAVEGNMAAVQASAEQVRAYTAQAEGYRAIIQARTAQIDGIARTNEAIQKKFTNKVEAYRVLIQARQIAADSVVRNNEAMTRQYVADIGAAEALIRGRVAQSEAVSRANESRIRIYSARIEALRAITLARTAQADQIARTNEAIQKSFALQIEAYRAIIGARSAEAEGTIRINEGLTRQYLAQSDAYRAVIQARVAKIEGIAKFNEANQRQFTALVDAYRARVTALAEVNRAEIESFRETLAAFLAKANSIAVRDSANITRYEAANRAVIAASEMYFRLLHEQHDLDKSRIETVAKLEIANADIIARLGASTLSGMTTLVGQINTD